MVGVGEAGCDDCVYGWDHTLHCRVQDPNLDCIVRDSQPKRVPPRSAKGSYTVLYYEGCVIAQTFVVEPHVR